MKLTLIRILCFCMIPLGASLLYKTIRIVRKSFGGETLVEIPFLKKAGTFEIAKPGVYAVWQKGQVFRRLPVDQFRPVITHELTGQRIVLYPSILRPNSNDGTTFRMELFRFSAAPGTYSVDLAEGSSLSVPERMISRLIPAREADISRYSIQVRESQPLVYIVMGIPFMAIAGILMIGGLVIGILADQIFHNLL